MKPEATANNDTRSIGRWMIIATWLLLFGILTFIFGNLIEKQANPNSDPETITETNGQKHVVLKRNRYGHYVATGAINNHPVRFLVDTGATDVALPASLAKKLKLERGARYTSRTANGSVTAWQTRLNRVSLGEISVENVRASILPSLAEGEVLLGMSFLKHLEIVQRDGVMKLTR